MPTANSAIPQDLTFWHKTWHDWRVSYETWMKKDSLTVCARRDFATLLFGRTAPTPSIPTMSIRERLRTSF